MPASRRRASLCSMSPPSMGGGRARREPLALSQWCVLSGTTLKMPPRDSCGHFADSMTNAASTVPRGSGKRLAVACSACPPRGATDATTKHRVPRPPDTHDHNPLTNCANKLSNADGGLTNISPFVHPAWQAGQYKGEDRRVCVAACVLCSCQVAASCHPSSARVELDQNSMEGDTSTLL